MPVAGGGFEQDLQRRKPWWPADSLLVVTNDVVSGPQRIEARQKVAAGAGSARPPIPEALSTAPETLLADSGYFSEANVKLQCCRGRDRRR